MARVAAGIQRRIKDCDSHSGLGVSITKSEMTSNTSTTDHPGRSLRRSTRLNQIISLTVVGVDSYRGPYREEVSTLTINCHGCRYRSKHEVFTNAWVILELPAKKLGGPPITSRGIVKWVERSVNEAGPQLTAIELDEPGNIWGIIAPPSDWLKYCGRRVPVGSTAKPKPFAVLKSKTPGAVAVEATTSSSPPVASTDRPPGRLMGDFQRQMEQTLFDTANTVVRERTTSVLGEVRASMRDEAKCLLSEAAAAQATAWMADCVKQMKQASHDSARALYAEWTKKMNADLQMAGERLEARKQDLDQQVQGLSAVAIERVQCGLETSQKEAVNRIVGRLKEHLAPVVDDAKKAAADMSRNREKLKKMMDQVLDKSSVRMEEICARCDNKFEIAIQLYLDGSREDLHRVSQGVTNLALNKLQVIALHYESEARTCFQAALESVAANTVIDLKERATETSRQFAGELADYGRSYVEFVGRSVTDLAKRLDERSKE
jgi:hypothetical protein